MSLITPRAYWDNLSRQSGVLITASSQDPAFPVARVLDQRRSKTWRSQLGFNIVAGVNDALDFTEGITGAKVAFIPAGNYATGFELALEVEIQINLVATDNTYAFKYSSVTRRFTLTRLVGLNDIDLNWSTGPNAADTIGEDVGFDVSTDDTGASLYVGDNTVQMSAEWVLIDLITAQGVDAAIALLGAKSEDVAVLSSSGVLTIQGNATDDFSSPTFEAILSDGDVKDVSKLLDFFAATETFRFWRFFFEDRDNQAGFMQMGAAWIGPKTEFDRCYALNLAEARRELSRITQGDHGSIFTDVKPTRREWSFAFRETTDVDKDRWEDIADRVKVGDHMFYSLDPLNKPLTHTVYGYVRTPGISFEHIRSEDVGPTTTPQGQWNISFPFSEAIG